MYPKIKRYIDFYLSIIIVFFLSPILFVSIIAILLTMGRPIVFTQLRSGKNKKQIRVYKLRSMIEDPSGTLSDYERITKVGKIIRKLSIDEIPQLFNVLRGEMSLVGPRPLLPEYDDKYSEMQNTRFEVLPGITGLAQINGRNNITWEDKLSYDVKYVRNVSFLLDVSILLRTVVIVLRSKGFKPAGEDKKFGEHL